MKTPFFLLLSMACIVCLISPASRAGVESGGGGGVLFRNSRPVLIDFFNIDFNFRDQDFFRDKIASRLSETRSIQLAFDQESETQIRNTHSAFDLAFQILQPWQKLSYDIAGLTVLTAFYRPVQWSFVDKDLQAPPVYLPKGISSSEKIQIAAYYSAAPHQFTVEISKPIWNQMGILSQAGLLIHESLRHLQIGLSRSFDEQTLQQATSILVMCEPKGRLSYYLQYLFMNRSDLAQALYGNFKDLMKSDCRRTF